METMDYKKALKELYVVPKNKQVVVDVPAAPYLLIDGTGDPNTSQHFQQAVEALFSVSYKLKFTVKKDLGRLDYKVMPLSGYWTLVDPQAKDPMNRDNWAWTVGIQQPELVDTELFESARETVKKKKKQLETLDELRFETVNDGLCAQILHIGPFADEPQSFAVLDAFIDEQGYRMREAGHREIYLSDFNKTAPEKLKTILRKKIEKA
jgi:hypothetical protein